MERLEKQRRKKNHYILCLFLVLVMAIVVVGILNREWIYDWYRGVSYNPSTEMLRIRNKLELTGDGEFLFNATQPVLSEAKEFNQQCRQDDDEVAILGCYNDGNIYVYNIVAEELNGIRELTTAHELLHARWERMSEEKRRELVEPLTRVFDANQELLGDEINQYDISEKQEELYVRAGTEVKNLPENLEKHFAEIFSDQDKIVDFYESYVTVFCEIKDRMAKLMDEMEDLKEEIGVRTAEYEKQALQLEADIVSFNSCAEVEGCFGSNREFYDRRSQILNRQEELVRMNDEINEMINEYNEMVDAYNADVTESHKMQDMINSNVVPEME